MSDHHSLKVLQVNLALCLLVSKCIIPIARCFQSVYCSVFSEAACLYLHGQLWHPGWVLSSLHPTGKYHLWWITSTRCRKFVCPWTSILLCKSVTVAPQAGPSTTVQASRKQFTSTFTGGSGTQSGSSTLLPLQGSTAYGGSPQRQDAASQLVRGWSAPYASVSLSSPQAVAGPSTVQGSRKQFTSTFTGGSGTQSGSSTLLPLQGSTAYGGSPQDVASPLHPGSSPYASVSLSSPHGAASKSSQSYQGYSVSQSQESQKWQPSATRLTQAIRTSDATASQGSSSSQSPPMQFSSLSSAGGSSRVSGPFVSAHGGSTSYGGSFQSQSLSTKYTPGSQHFPYDAGVAGRGTSSASEVLSSYSSMNNQNAPAQPSYSVKG